MTPSTRRSTATHTLATSAIALATVQATMLAPALPAVAAPAAAAPALGDAALADDTRFLTPVARDAGGEIYEVTGFLHLVKVSAEVSEFILVSDMGVCPWCGGADHGTALEVQLADPAARLEHGQRITVRGQLEDVRGLDAHMTTRMVAASIL
ncbi:MAG: hypothetical protein AAFP13_02935 [Pseudomonadota bacterium]